MDEGTVILEEEHRRALVELRLQMYLACNRSLPPSLPVHCHDVLSDLRYVTAPGLIFIQSAHGHFTPGSFINEY